MGEQFIGSIILGALATIAILLVVFLIIRELVLWYFRINERTRLLKSIDRQLSLLLQKETPSDDKEESVSVATGNIEGTASTQGAGHQ